jgi:hypothetical protein
MTETAPAILWMSSKTPRLTRHTLRRLPLMKASSGKKYFSVYVGKMPEAKSDRERDL